MNALKTLIIAGALCAASTAALAQEGQYCESITTFSGFSVGLG